MPDPCVPPEFPTEAAVHAGDAAGTWTLAMETLATGPNTAALAASYRATVRATVAADWPLLAAAAIRQAVARLTFEDLVAIHVADTPSLTTEAFERILLATLESPHAPQS